MNIIKNKRISVFDSDKELRISLFRIMAAFGTTISTAAGLSNLFFGLPLINAVCCLVPAALSLFLRAATLEPAAGPLYTSRPVL